jgi:Flp pilus assembly protein TadG
MFLNLCRRPRKLAGKERGQAILEFIPVSLFMLTLAFAIIDFSYLIWQWQVITSLTREGSNLASRDDTLAVAAAAVVNDGKALNLNSANGKVIITTVQNTAAGLNSGTATASNFVITGQYSLGSYQASSKLGTYTGSGTPAATLTAQSPPVPQPGATVFITEIFYKYTPITPLGALVKYTMPTELYDVAYF